MSEQLTKAVWTSGARIQTQAKPSPAYGYDTHRIEVLSGPESGVYDIRTWGRCVDMRGICLDWEVHGLRGSIKQQIREYCLRHLVNLVEITYTPPDAE